VLTRVPVQVAGGGSFALSFPIKQGDECLLIFGDRSIDNWFIKGGDQDPVDLRRHALSDAVAIVGIRSKPSKLADYDGDRAVLGKQGGKKIALEQGMVHLGVDHAESASAFVALANLVNDRLDKIQQKFDAHTHKLSMITVNTQGTAVKQIAKPGDTTGSTDAPEGIGSLESVAASFVKAK